MKSIIIWDGMEIIRAGIGFGILLAFGLILLGCAIVDRVNKWRKH